MGIETFVDEGTTVLGPCPGCTLWTVQYDHAMVVADYWSTADFHEDIEALLREHLDECAALQEYVAML
jgi:Fe-S oxidoreductase